MRNLQQSLGPTAQLAVGAGGCILLFSCLSGFFGLKSVLALTPGNTLLGNFYVWNFLTYHFVETEFVKLLLALVILAGFALLAQSATAVHASQQQHPLQKQQALVRLGLTLAFSLALCGLLQMAWNMLKFMTGIGAAPAEGKARAGAGYEGYLYTPITGSSGLLAVFAVAAFQAGGDAALAPQLPFLTFSLLPLAVLIYSFFCGQLGLGQGDFFAACWCTLISWSYLRFLHHYPEGSAAAAVTVPGRPGDLREEFLFELMLPGPLRLPARPFIKLCSAFFLRLTPFSWSGAGSSNLLPYTSLNSAAPATAAGGGIAASAMGGLSNLANSFSSSVSSRLLDASGASSTAGGSSANAAAAGPAGGTLNAATMGYGTRVVADPVAERRRQLALAALDKRLAELRATAVVGAGSAAPLPVLGGSRVSTGAAAMPAIVALPSSPAPLPHGALSSPAAAFVAPAVPSTPESAAVTAAPADAVAVQEPALVQ